MECVWIYHTSSERPVVFAAQELARYLRRMSGHSVCLESVGLKAYDPLVSKALWVGQLSAFKGPGMLGEADCPLDDAILLNVAELKGIIAGSNPRSVLLGVYRLLAEAGACWLRPGEDGEYVPRVDLSQFSVRLCEKPSYRHRGVCIEGAVSCENVLRMIDFLPKIGLNSYFLQFREAYVFYERWYSHKNNSFKPPEAFSIEDARAYTRKAEDEIEKRGLIYHAVGHGWTCEPLGIPGLGWDEREYDVPPAAAGYLAQVDGRRALFGGIPLNTNLCYSNPAVQELMVQSAAAYIREHRNIDVLHFWLADEKNNQCECEACRQKRPSDYFVRILNLLDARLTQEHLTTKIVFLIYMDLLWPPEEEVICHPDRFILMFAPITRTYRAVFSDGETAEALPPYIRNRLEFPSSVDSNLAFLRAWREKFPGDSFDFDYHLWWNLYSDPAHYGVPELLSLDLKNLKELGLNGYLSCQVQRAFFPTGLGMAVLGRTLWQSGTDFSTIAADYFAGAFGEDGPLCQEYLRELSALLDLGRLREERPSSISQAIRALERVPQLIRDFRPILLRNANQDDLARRRSWECLGHHSFICASLAKVFRAKARGEYGKAKAIWQRLKDHVSKCEDELQSELDVFEFVQEYEKMLGRDEVPV